MKEALISEISCGSYSPIVRNLGLVEYLDTWQEMRSFNERRSHSTQDEFWCLQHFPVYTQGQAGKPEHILHPQNIPVVQTDRGGQVTYHGPGQWVIYLLIDIQRKGLGVRAFVSKIEQAIIDMLAEYGVVAVANVKAPGVYVDGAKIASLGLRIRKGKSYHGLSLNVDMDLSPFQGINPCGYSNLSVVQMKDLIPTLDFEDVKQRLLRQLWIHLEYTTLSDQGINER